MRTHLAHCRASFNGARLFAALIYACLLSHSGFGQGADRELKFGRDVLPILSENCFACHGPDPGKRQGELRLDTREGALKSLNLQTPDDSELLKRVRTDDADALMPPPESHKKRLTAEQIDTLRRWIAAEAPWGRHWSFEEPTQAAVPELAPHPIDAFVLERLKAEGIDPLEQAAPYTLLRRLSFDLTGLPPTAGEVHEFNTAVEQAGFLKAYEAAVDRLLNSPHYGERMAMWWLDAARYADTDGFQGDDTRTNWPWRDWVVSAFNADMPFDRFTLEQFAGDLLPDATDEQKLVTCFHRNHMTNGEGGRDPEESRIDYVIDRVNTTGTVWLGLTLGCCQCHSHKYDPVSQHDYYSLAAFFDSIDEDGKAGRNAKPYLAYQSSLAARSAEEAQQVVEARKPLELAARKQAEEPFRDWYAAEINRIKPGFVAWRSLNISSLSTAEGTELSETQEHEIVAGGPNLFQDDYRVSGRSDLKRITGVRIDVLPHTDHTGGGLSRGASGEFILTDVKIQVRRAGNSQVRDIALAGAVADVAGSQKEARAYGDVKGILDDDPRNGWTTKGHDANQMHSAVLALAEPLVPDADEELLIELRQRSTLGDANIGRFRISLTDQAGPAVLTTGPMPMERLLSAGLPEFDKVEEALRKDLFEQFLADHEAYQTERRSLERAERQAKETKDATKKIDVMVLAERSEPRTTHVLLRGVWDKKGDVVLRAFPPALSSPDEQSSAGTAEPTSSATIRSRLDLARWLTDRRNPLTARVTVNHLWQMMFGTGLVRTVDDFGLQGERPTHPELLDWLAVDFIEHGWNIKRTIKQMVMSETYRRTSRTTHELLSRDPDNRLLARASRYRRPSWMLRDAALRVSGLMNPALGGPPIKPFQPDGVWEELFMGRFRYDPSEGPAQYRRTLYTFQRRSIAPTFLFDAAQRRVCEVRVSRTNTPLQALTLMNDQNQLRAAWALAERTERSDQSSEAILAAMAFAVLSRELDVDERRLLMKEFEQANNHFSAVSKDADKLASISLGDTDHGSALSKKHDAEVKSDAAPMQAEIAAAAVAAQLLLNLDEAINRE
ncbi:MAG: PSD1 and planctomycete cytochrome C domain-containing protein [Pirellulales bacterium]